MSMTIAEMRAFVLSHLDTDSTELPDTLLDSYRVEGENRIQLASQRWSFYEATWSLTTVASTRAYALADLAVFGVVPVDVFAIQGPRWRLEPRSNESMEERFEFTTAAGQPRFWSQWAGSINLWPTPDAVYTMTVRGQRSPIVRTAADLSPDLPAEFHPLVAQWMLGRAYQQQDDVSTSPMLFRQFEDQLQVLRKRYEVVGRAGVRTLGGTKQSGLSRTNGRLLYPWE